MRGIGRALFFTLIGQRIVILHGFIKNAQQIPAVDLRFTRARIKDVTL
ncbi:type II toxin-antitoxin system RelE/ParE family toxin [Pseudomonas deceptionensis]